MRADELVHRVGARHHGSRARSKIQHRKIRFVIFVHDRFHLGMYAGIAGQIDGEFVVNLTT